jgi:hypothetical protein
VLNTISDLSKYLADKWLRQLLFLGFELLEELIKLLAFAMLHQQVKIGFIFKTVI